MTSERPAATTPTPEQLLEAAAIVERWAESRGEPQAQEVTMARYTADNMKLTALAESASSGAGR